MRAVLTSSWTIAALMLITFAVTGFHALDTVRRSLDPDLAGAAATVRESASSVVVDVTVVGEGPQVYGVWVAVDPETTDAQARDLWCWVILPTGVPRRWWQVELEAPGGRWPAPTDCDDPADIPSFERW